MSAQISLLWESLGKNSGSLRNSAGSREEDYLSGQESNSKWSLESAGRLTVHYLAEKVTTGSAISACGEFPELRKKILFAFSPI